MPTYEYVCANDHAFERIQKMNDRPVARCPDCGATAARKISGGQGLIFKGSGFYITDYGKDGKGPRKDGDAAAKIAEASATPKSEGKPDTKPDSKPDSKPDTKPESKSASLPKADAAPKSDKKSSSRPTDAA